MTVVAAERVVKTYGEGRAARRVLDGASLHVQAGEIVAILGRSGTGKSTLLHLIGGLDTPDAGEISVDGERVTGASERTLSRLRAQRIGFVFQFFHLLPELTGEANVLLAGRVRGAELGAARARAGADRPARAARGRGLAAASALRRRAAAVRDRARAGQRSGGPARRRADGQPRHARRRRGAAAAARRCRGGPRGDPGHARAGRRRHRRPRADAPGRAPDPVIRDALAALRARRGRTILAAVGVLAASLVVGTATTVGYSLATGFDRAADRADLPDIIARFGGEEMRDIDPAGLLAAQPRGAVLPQRGAQSPPPVRLPPNRQGRDRRRCSAVAAATWSWKAATSATARPATSSSSADWRASGASASATPSPSADTSGYASSASRSRPTTSRIRWRARRASTSPPSRCVGDRATTRRTSRCCG